jgi:hypothetical protein
MLAGDSTGAGNDLCGDYTEHLSCRRQSDLGLGGYHKGTGGARNGAIGVWPLWSGWKGFRMLRRNFGCGMSPKGDEVFVSAAGPTGQRGNPLKTGTVENGRGC